MLFSEIFKLGDFPNFLLAHPVEKKIDFQVLAQRARTQHNGGKHSGLKKLGFHGLKNGLHFKLW